jgi:hypothetical protein
LSPQLTPTATLFRGCPAPIHSRRSANVIIKEHVSTVVMGHLKYGTVAKGVSRENLFQWYTDFSPEDVDIMKRRSDGRLLSRVCTRDGNKLHIESENRGFGSKPVKVTADAVVHPEDYTYDIHSSAPGMFEDDRHYTFTQEPDGTRIAFEANFHATGRSLKFLGAIGILGWLLNKGSKQTLNAYVAEAEAQLGQKQ